MNLNNYSYSYTDLGDRSENQDCFATLDLENGFLLIVCDGMGGTAGGKIASELAVKTIIDNIYDVKVSDFQRKILPLIQLANSSIYKESIKNPDLKGMGTTIAVLVITENCAYTFHVGDSRIYQIRNGKIIFRTNDHSKVFELVKRGIITEEQARLSEDSNIVLRALGIKPEVEIEVHDNITFKKNDRFMLCTDGISGAISKKQLIQKLKQKKPPKDIIHEIIYFIKENKIDTEINLDNMTISIIDTQFNSILKAKTPMKTKIIYVLLSLLLVLSIVINVLQFKGIIAQQKINPVLIKKDTLINNQIKDIIDTQKIDKRINPLNQEKLPVYKVNKDLKIEIDSTKRKTL